MRFKQLPTILFLMIVSLFLLIACTATDKPSVNVQPTNNGHSGGHAMDGGDHAEVPTEYKGLTNPLSANSENVLQAGQTIFQTNCVVCHGEIGRGDGVAATTLNPKPANLADEMMMSMVTDDYLFWRVRKGGIGEPFNSAMPNWENSLSEEETWQVVAYIRTLSKKQN
ncbi:MAG TPA: cytochrome c [Anaerolineae bacterium]|nr:cytochrome c [Anaerolineae bacterium]